MYKKVKAQDAIGMVIAHDMTKIIPGKYKGARFKRGHVITEEDIPELLSMGKKHVYIDDGGIEDAIHEDEAANRLATAISGENTVFANVNQGRLNIKSTINGLLKINRKLLTKINSMDNIIIATLHDNTPVNAGQPVAGTKIISLAIEEEGVKQVERLTHSEGKVVYVKPYIIKKVGVVVTGNEVYSGLIEDKFMDVICSKLAPLGASICCSKIVPDCEEEISSAIIEMKNAGAELIITCGGLAVDADDVTVDGLLKSGATIIKHGIPIMPGAMALLARLDKIPILGAPAGGLFSTTGVDALLPRLIAGETVTREEAVDYGYGGLCLNCAECLYPICPFCHV